MEATMRSCDCKCGSTEAYGTFHVTPTQVFWFVDKHHKEKFLGEQFGVNVTPKPAAASPQPAYVYM
jgi:hypothetical protein